jgi:ribosomal protein S19E (S16A)
MNMYQIEVVDQADNDLVWKILQTLEQRGLITLKTGDHVDAEKATPATDEQVQEIIDEAELAPYYSEKEAKDILNL